MADTKENLQMLQMLRNMQTQKEGKKKRGFETQLKELNLEQKQREKEAPVGMVREMMGNLGDIESYSGIGAYPGGFAESIKKWAGYNPELEAYESQTEAFASPLAKSLMGETKVTDEDVKRIQAMFPKQYDPTEVRARKLKGFLNLLQQGTGYQDLESLVPKNLMQEYLKLR
jgi:hypothetical protein